MFRTGFGVIIDLKEAYGNIGKIKIPSQESGLSGIRKCSDYLLNSGKLRGLLMPIVILIRASSESPFFL